MTGYVSLSLSWIMGSLCTFLSCESPLATTVGELHQCSRKRMGRCSRRLSWKPRRRERVHVLYVSFYEFFVWHVPATHWYVTVCSWSTSWSTEYQDLDCMSPDCCWLISESLLESDLSHTFAPLGIQQMNMFHIFPTYRSIYSWWAPCFQDSSTCQSTLSFASKNSFPIPQRLPVKAKTRSSVLGGLVPGSSGSVGSFFSEVCCWDGTTASFLLETLKIKATAQLVHTQPISTEVSLLFTIGISLFRRPS